MLHKHTISILNESVNWCLFATQTEYSLPKYLANPLSVSNLCPNSFHNFLLDCLMTVATVLHGAEYCNRNCSDDLFVNQTQNIAFFALIAFLTSWFHQAILFSLPV